MALARDHGRLHRHPHRGLRPVRRRADRGLCAGRALASGPDAYAHGDGGGGLVLGKLVLFGLTAALFYHHGGGRSGTSCWDSGTGFLPTTANMTSWFAFAFGVVASVLVFAGYFLLGHA